jgi:hypothetical protein
MKNPARIFREFANASKNNRDICLSQLIVEKLSLFQKEKHESQINHYAILFMKFY